jgi:hypothetical protein
MAAAAMPTSVVLGAAGFALYVAAVAVILRLRRTASPALVAIAAALFAYLAVLVAAIVISRTVNFWTMSVLFWFPTMIFLLAFGALYKSVSLRILVDLLARPGQTELCSIILERYIAAESFESRLALMLENKWAIPTSAGYALTERGERLARLVAVLQRVFAIQRSG